MKYFAILLLFLCFASGLTSLTIISLLYNKYKYLEIKKYLYLFLTVTFISIVVTFNFYYKSVFNIPSNRIYDLFFFIFLLAGVCFYIYTFPVFVYSLIKKHFFNIFFLISLMIIPFVILSAFFFINIFFKYDYEFYTIPFYFANPMLAFIFIHIFFFITFNLKKIKNPTRIKFLRYVRIFILCYLPFALIDAFYDNFFFIFKHLPDGFSFTMPFYLALNTGVIFISIKYINNTSKIFELSPFNLDKYNITEREKEICNCIINGCSNKEICDKLFISLTTVKKHIYNLFLKTDAKNRIDLINILKNDR